jgi:hypothetical protein
MKAEASSIGEINQVQPDKLKMCGAELVSAPHIVCDGYQL